MRATATSALNRCSRYNTRLLSATENSQIAHMNGDAPKIEIFKPFGEAFELTKKILFQPFDLAKWFVIGFAAFLASLSGGMHFNFNGFNRNRDWHWKFSSVRHDMMETSTHWPGWIIPLIVVGVLLVLALVVLCMWLGARGRFMFVDCIVRNRAAIKEPWREFRTEGNSLLSVFAHRRVAASDRGGDYGRADFPAFSSASPQSPFKKGDDCLAGLFRNDRAFTRLRMELDLAADGAGDVSQTMPRDRGFSRRAGIDFQSSRAPDSVFPVFHRARHCHDCRRLCSDMPNMLHRGDPIRRNGDFVADPCAPLRIHALVPSAIWQ